MSHIEADIIRAGALWGYCQLTRFLAHDPRPLLTSAGLKETDLDNPDRYLERPAVAALLERSAEALGCSDFGLRLAGVQDIHILGALAFAIRNSPDLRSALATTVKHVSYQSPLASIALGPGEEGGEEVITFNHAGKHVASSTQITEHAIGLFCRIYRHLADAQFKPTGVTFVHAPRSSSDRYVGHFGVPPQFACAAVTVRVDRRVLSLPLKDANPQFRALVERYLELNSPHAGPDIGRRVHQAVAQIMRNGNATIDDASSMLHMHARTLQRRLMEEGTTFEEVRDDVRKQMAEIYLANDVVPLAHVAHLLGYSSQSVLTRSCLRWFGKTPLAMRRRVRRTR